ncbi:MAG: hypothetical protein JHC21_01460 [Thermocrinis sp.]|nr:hypothetical protein [Thermocrinis sp.]
MPILRRHLEKLVACRYRVKPIGRQRRGETAERLMLEDDRLRLTADGKLFTCLFASYDYDLKSLLRAFEKGHKAQKSGDV